jgi:hypothetical protein
MKIMILMATTMMTMMVAGAQAKADGFGTDLLFDNLIAPSHLIAHAACPDFKILAGENLKVSAQEESFTIEDTDGNQLVNILVPSEGNYVFQGQSPNRIANEIVSKTEGIIASMNSISTDITIVKLSSGENPCTLTRCPAFGDCN